MEGQRKRERVQSQRVEPRRHGNRTNLRSAPGIQPKGHLVCTTSGTNVCDLDSTGLEDLKHREVIPVHQSKDPFPNNVVAMVPIDSANISRE